MNDPVPNPTICFIDTETTGLEPDRHEMWELALIVRRPGQEVQELTYQFPVQLRTADPTALRINGFYDRYAPPVGFWDLGVIEHMREQATEIARLTAGAWLVGSVPSFDASFLEPMLREYGAAPAWHYRLVCVESLAAGALGQRPPWSTDDLGERLGVPKDKTDQHTAMGDARWAMKIYDAVMEVDRRRSVTAPIRPPVVVAEEPIVAMPAEEADEDPDDPPPPPSLTEATPCSSCGTPVEPRAATVSFTVLQKVLCMEPDGGCYDRYTLEEAGSE